MILQIIKLCKLSEYPLDFFPDRLNLYAGIYLQSSDLELLLTRPQDLGRQDPIILQKIAISTGRSYCWSARF